MGAKNKLPIDELAALWAPFDRKLDSTQDKRFHVVAGFSLYCVSVSLFRLKDFFVHVVEDDDELNGEKSVKEAEEEAMKANLEMLIVCLGFPNNICVGPSCETLEDHDLLGSCSSTLAEDDGLPGEKGPWDLANAGL